MMTELNSTTTYLLSDELKAATQLAIDLEKPLLIKGEPGTGKTVLAEAVAEQLQVPLIRWHVKSTTKAADGLYIYDTIQRLNDARFGDGDVKDISRYIKYGPLGQAFRSDKRVVVLIDEIDKADIEFPNDLLHELDRMSFDVLETNETVTANIRPIVFMTSNNEKELPDAFLRRCIFHWIDFPSQELMRDIVKMHQPAIEERLLEDALERFYWLRSQHGIRKHPSTSELLDWVKALSQNGVSLEKVGQKLPFLGTLLKREQDMQALQPTSIRNRFV